MWGKAFLIQHRTHRVRHIFCPESRPATRRMCATTFWTAFKAVMHLWLLQSVRHHVVRRVLRRAQLLLVTYHEISATHSAMTRDSVPKVTPTGSFSLDCRLPCAWHSLPGCSAVWPSCSASPGNIQSSQDKASAKEITRIRRGYSSHTSLCVLSDGMSSAHASSIMIHYVFITRTEAHRELCVCVCLSRYSRAHLGFQRRVRASHRTIRR